MKTFLLLIALAAQAARADYPAEFEPVVRLFSGISFANHDMIREATSDDFLLLEVGEVWDREMLLRAVVASGHQRVNYFGVISVDRFGEVALVNYWNKALITGQGAPSARAWLESVVVELGADGWTIRQMHSTRIEPQKIPETVALKPMMIDARE